MRRHKILIFLERLRPGYFYSKVDYNPQIKHQYSDRETNYHLEALFLVLAVFPVAGPAEENRFPGVLQSQEEERFLLRTTLQSHFSWGLVRLMSLCRPCPVVSTDTTSLSQSCSGGMHILNRSHLDCSDLNIKKFCYFFHSLFSVGFFLNTSFNPEDSVSHELVFSKRYEAI